MAGCVVGVGWFGISRAVVEEDTRARSQFRNAPCACGLRSTRSCGPVPAVLTQRPDTIFSQSLHPRKYRANFNVLCGAVASGECHLCAVCVELDEMEFGLVDMNVLSAMVAIAIILRQSNILFAS